jgi:hypothetical protein
LVGEYKMPQNHASYCSGPEGQDKTNTLATSYAAHNPTLVGDLAFITWHSNGLQAVSLADPAHPVGVGAFMPTPLDRVVTEDPALSMGRSKVVAWSYPIIKDGLIYIVDVRNGLFVVRYTGVGASRVSAVSFLEGNSNLGDALALDGVSVLGARQSRRSVSGAVVGHDPLPSTGVGVEWWVALLIVGVAVVGAMRLRRANA